ncbi:MAG: hydroxyacid dehydrogenase, partial [Aliifodinibius sp.]|nr:hydroxyacid dehydrogenase [Fodinibius sp.]NIY30595.1 hydroxyacid dehydrogenase [Fodinibius sp.]
VAEHVVMFILTLMKKGVYAHKATSRGNWPQWELLIENRTMELGGKTLGILGLGAVGREVTKIIKG